MNIKSILVSAVGVAAAVAAASQPAYSSTLAGMAGHGWPNHFDTCFTSSWARMTNSCGGTVGSTHLLIVPVILSHSSTNSTSVSASGNGVNGFTTCQALAIDAGNGGFSFSANVSTSTSSSPQILALGNVNAPTGGTLHYECQVAQGGGSVINVEYH